ncbi:hypothetical protein [Streptomyces zagrosensis]|uniref:Large membrane protein n=1 Tax=Streptomyces zagrosensis TaxID=1042984 RepID=A0A7W9Q4W7_9ACTN|nr:hypothetical protein [Streptomyces zagrosensis]MBB5933414.1 hypothetical protein [Streptomyces zagrosensis]
MSTEDTPEDLSKETSDYTDTKTARKRRSPLTIATVAAAVLVVGGGGAYWASAASDDGGSKDGGRSSDAAEPAPLALDSTTGEAREGIAVGEPSPTRARYQAPGELPDAPRETAPVYRSGQKVARADVERLAAALKVSGTPRLEQGVWTVGGTPNRMSPTLRVKETGAGGWSFTKAGAPGGDGCLEPPHTMENGDSPDSSAPSCGSLRDGRGERAGGAKDARQSRDAKDPKSAPATVDGGKDPVSAAEAKDAAQPVLKTLGQSDAKLDASRTYGAIRGVTADPVFDGLPTYGWQTNVEVGVDGEVADASGFLSKLTKGDEYPLISADQALKALNAQGGSEGGVSIGGCASAEPATPDKGSKGDEAHQGGDDKREIAPCEPSPGKQPAAEVRKATFGLGMRFVEGQQTLVPSWMFTVHPADAKDGEADFTVTQPAVDPKYVAGPKTAPSTPADEGSGSKTGDGAHPLKQVESYRTHGKELTVRFWGGVCSTYTATADTSSSTVKVQVNSAPEKPGGNCIHLAKEFEKKITLDGPLDGREVMDAASGKTVPKGSSKNK